MKKLFKEAKTQALSAPPFDGNSKVKAKRSIDVSERMDTNTLLVINYQTTANSHTKQKHEAKRCPLLGCLVVMADGEALYFRFLLAFISSSPGIR